MSEIDETKKMQMITRLLEKGGTMLATHHDCGAPMFRYQGVVLCPVCDFGGKVKEKPQGDPGTKIEPVLEKIPQKEALAADYSKIDTAVKYKIQSIASSLENETDLQRVKEKMECIELGIKILKLLG